MKIYIPPLKPYTQRTPTLPPIKTQPEFVAIPPDASILLEPHHTSPLHPERVTRHVFDPQINRRILAGPTSAHLQASLDTVSTANLSNDVYYLASPELAGRGTPSTGLTIAGNYFIKHLQVNGWLPGTSDASYRYTYNLRRAHFDTTNNTMAFSSRGRSTALKFGDDYFFTSLQDKQQTELVGDAVYLEPSDRQHLAEIDLKDKWIVVHDKEFDVQERRIIAINKDARGVVVIPSLDMTDARYQHRLSLLKGLNKNGETHFNSNDPVDEIFITPQKALALFGTADDLKNSDITEPTSRPLAVEGHRHVAIETTMAQADNILGFYEGHDPALKDEVILITAHYDHLGQHRGVIYPGADDNASGSSALLALVEAIPELALGRSVMIMWVSGEELGLLGSDAWARNPDLPAGKHVIANLNMDMVGRNETHELLVTPSPDSHMYNGLGCRILKHAASEGFTHIRSADKYWRRSDQYSFYQHMGIPVSFVTNDTHADYHEPTDTPDKINYDKIYHMTRLILRVLDDMREVELDL